MNLIKKKYKIVVLLIDDEQMIGDLLRVMLLSEDEICFHFISDPSKALDKAIEISPTVILLDILMPQINGLTLAKLFRDNPKTCDIPLIVLSSKEDPKTKAKAFSIGVNDYLIKLPDKIELIARLKYHSKGYINLLERNEAYFALEKSQKKLKKELNEAAQYVRSLLPEKLNGAITTDWKYITSTYVGGDSFDYHWIDDDNFVIYMLDVCGHGVAATLLSMTVLDIVRLQSLENTDYKNPKEVLFKLNNIFQMEKHDDKYFTLWYGVYNKKKNNLVYASGGHPQPILLSGKSFDTLKLQKLELGGTIIGVKPNMLFENNTINLSDINILYLFTDGVYELIKKDDLLWTYEDFVKLLKESLNSFNPDIESIYQSIAKIQESSNFRDDFSLLQVIIQK